VKKTLWGKKRGKRNQIGPKSNVWVRRSGARERHNDRSSYYKWIGSSVGAGEGPVRHGVPAEGSGSYFEIGCNRKDNGKEEVKGSSGRISHGRKMEAGELKGIGHTHVIENRKRKRTAHEIMRRPHEWRGGIWVGE